MTGFFNKYGNTLLMFFMALLLVVFLVPSDFFFRRPGPRDIELGEANGKTVTSSMVSSAAAEHEIAQLLGIARTVSFQSNPDIYMLLQDVRSTGIQFPQSHVESVIAAMKAQNERNRETFKDSPYLRAFPPVSDVYSLREKYGVKLSEIYRICGEWIAVERLQKMQGVPQSLPRQMHEFRDEKQKATIKYSLVRANDLTDTIDATDEKALKDFFDARKDQETQHTVDGLSFGFKRPMMVKAAFITVDRSKLEDDVITSREAKEYFESQPKNEGVEFTDAIKSATKYQLKKIRRIEKANGILGDLQQNAPRPIESIEALVASCPYKDALVVTRFDEWMSLEDAVGKAQSRDDMQAATLMQATQGRLPACYAMFQVKDYMEDVPEDTYIPTVTVNEPSPLFVVPDRSSRRSDPKAATFFVVTAARKAGAPEFEEVRDQVVESYKLAKAYERAEELANHLKTEAAANGGLEAGFDASKEWLRQRMMTPEELIAEAAEGEEAAPDPTLLRDVESIQPNTTKDFGRMQPALASASNLDTLAEQVFAVESVENTPLDGRLFVGGSPMSQIWVVAQLEGFSDLTQDEFKKSRANLSQRLVSQLKVAWAKSDNLRTRMNWDPVGEDPNENGEVAE